MDAISTARNSGDGLTMVKAVSRSAPTAESFFGSLVEWDGGVGLAAARAGRTSVELSKWESAPTMTRGRKLA